MIPPIPAVRCRVLSVRCRVHPQRFVPSGARSSQLRALRRPLRSLVSPLQGSSLIDRQPRALPGLACVAPSGRRTKTCSASDAHWVCATADEDASREFLSVRCRVHPQRFVPSGARSNRRRAQTFGWTRFNGLASRRAHVRARRPRSQEGLRNLLRGTCWLIARRACRGEPPWSPACGEVARDGPVASASMRVEKRWPTRNHTVIVRVRGGPKAQYQASPGQRPGSSDHCWASPKGAPQDLGASGAEHDVRRGAHEEGVTR